MQGFILRAIINLIIDHIIKKYLKTEKLENLTIDLIFKMKQKLIDFLSSPETDKIIIKIVKGNLPKIKQKLIKNLSNFDVDKAVIKKLKAKKFSN